MSDRRSIRPGRRPGSHRTRGAIRFARDAKTRGSGKAPSSRDGILGDPTSPRLSPKRHRGATRGRIALRVSRASSAGWKGAPLDLRSSRCPPQDYYEPMPPPAASCVGGPAWSKAQGSESCPVGVRRFKSCPTHQVECYDGQYVAPVGAWPASSSKDRNGRSTGTDRVGRRAHNVFRRTSLYRRLMNPTGVELGPEPADGRTPV